MYSNTVKPLNTGHSQSLKFCPLFGVVHYSEGSFYRKFVVCSLKNVRYFVVSVKGDFTVFYNFLLLIKRLPDLFKNVKYEVV